ncbi:MAG TPA: glutathione S-transferase family protein [Burkholderiaceae bacterium]
MIKLHYHPSNASFAPHVLLEELQQPFELKLVDRNNGAHKSAAYLKLNPNGLIPVLEDGDLVLYETAAILLHLADTHPAADLAPALGTPERAQFYKWMIWLTNTLQPLLIAYYYPERWVFEGNAEGTAQVKAQAEARIGPLLDQLDAHLKSHGGPWLLGAGYSAADPLAFMLCRWTRGFARPARSVGAIGAYLERMLARPAVQRAVATEQLPQPIY